MHIIQMATYTFHMITHICGPHITGALYDFHIFYRHDTDIKGAACDFYIIQT